MNDSQFTHSKADVYHLQQKLKRAEEMIRVMQMAAYATTVSKQGNLMKTGRSSAL